MTSANSFKWPISSIGCGVMPIIRRWSPRQAASPPLLGVVPCLFSFVLPFLKKELGSRWMPMYWVGCQDRALLQTRYSSTGFQGRRTISASSWNGGVGPAKSLKRS
ncbi:hypothetical protein PIB30_087025, partial [Stylosanthes scabra]|nr:hypothetical protein [Stylosanthes scabra]